MSKDKMEHIYHKFDRQAKEIQVEIKLCKYTIDGIPTCYAWSGACGHEAMICKFLQSYSFGTKHVCGILGEAIFAYKDSDVMLEPHNCCPLWHKENFDKR
jgi:hypothetical protein